MNYRPVAEIFSVAERSDTSRFKEKDGIQHVSDLELTGSCEREKISKA